jgi:hypothetical protein
MVDWIISSWPSDRPAEKMLLLPFLPSYKLSCTRIIIGGHNKTKKKKKKKKVLCRVNIIETWRTAAHTPVKRGSRLRPAVRSSLFDETAARAKDPKRELPILLEPLREIRLDGAR